MWGWETLEMRQTPSLQPEGWRGERIQTGTQGRESGEGESRVLAEGNLSQQDGGGSSRGDGRQALAGGSTALGQTPQGRLGLHLLWMRLQLRLPPVSAATALPLSQA